MTALRGDRTGLSGKRVLVTGGTGRLGRQLVAALNDAGARVSVLTRTAARAAELGPDRAIEYRYGDLKEPLSLDSALRDIELVFHLASYSPPPGAIDIYGAAPHWAVTAEGTNHLVRAAVAAGAVGFVFVSSVKAMGVAAGADGGPADESTPARPDTLYGHAKLEAERRVLAAGAADSMHVCVLRIPMVYGLPGEGNLGRMIEAVARRRFPPWPRLANRRSAVHALDVVAAALMVATDRRAAGRTYLVTDGRRYSTRWIYEQICLGLGRSVPRWTLPLWCWRFAALLGSIVQHVTKTPMPLTLGALEKLAGNACYSASRIRHELDFEPRYSLSTALPEMIAAHVLQQLPRRDSIHSHVALRSEAHAVRLSSRER